MLNRLVTSTRTTTVRQAHDRPRSRVIKLPGVNEQIPLIAANIAEAVGKTGKDDQKRYFSIARGSATESAAWYDILKVAGLVTEAQSDKAKADLERIVAMLTALCIRG